MDNKIRISKEAKEFILNTQKIKGLKTISRALDSIIKSHIENEQILLKSKLNEADLF